MNDPNNQQDRRPERRQRTDSHLVKWCMALILIGLALVVQLPGRTVALAQERKNDQDFREFSDLLVEIFNRVDANYVDKVDHKKLFEGAINGMMATLDPYSSWLPPEQQDALEKDTEGAYSGVGMHITLDEQRILTVLLPITGSPAAKAGIQPWDRVIQIDGKSTEDITLPEAVKMLTGPEGSEVTIKIWRPSTAELKDVTLKRQHIKVESVFHKMMDDGLGYLRIVKFQDDTANGVRKALEDFNKKNARGVVVDVRFNVGGLLERANEICDMFLPKGKLIVSIKGRNARDNRDYYSLNDPLCAQPMVVLVNSTSASASEIFAGAMKDNHRAVIIGPKGGTTYGKASVQTISSLRYSLDTDQYGNYLPSGLRLTTAHYYTPSGAMIMDKGISPDIGVELPAGHEAKLRAQGLLGDPNLDEPADDAAGNAASTPTPTPTPPPAETPAMRPGASNPDGGEPNLEENEKSSLDRMIERLNQSVQQANAPKIEEFHDILLDEAVKYLKAILIFQESEKPAA